MEKFFFLLFLFLCFFFITYIETYTYMLRYNTYYVIEFEDEVFLYFGSILICLNLIHIFFLVHKIENIVEESLYFAFICRLKHKTE